MPPPKSAMNVRGVRSIKTRMGIQSQDNKPYKKFMKITSLEVQKSRLESDRANLMKRINQIDSHLEQIANEQREIMEIIVKERDDLGLTKKLDDHSQIPSRPLKSPASVKTHANIPHQGDTGGFRMKY